jgi:peptide/nickel transport system permease protein
MGNSLFTQEPVSHLIASRLSVTAKLAGSALLFALIVSIPLGVASAYRRNSWVNWLETAVTTLGQAVPSFWLALMLSAFFGIYLGWLPVAGTESLQHFILPSITLGIAVIPVLTRITKTGIAEVLQTKYIKTARAKGLSTGQILIVHALPNAILPIISLTSVQLGQLLAGSVVIETVFAMDGIGRLALLSIERVDFPVVQAIVVCLVGIYVLLTFLADILNMLIDPRLRV